MVDHNDIAGAVVDKQLNKIYDEERKRLVLIPMPNYEQICPFIDKDQMFEIALRAVVTMRILAMARLN